MVYIPEEDLQPVVPTRSVARKSTAKKPADPSSTTNQIISNPVLTKPLVSQVPQGKVSVSEIHFKHKTILFNVLSSRLLMKLFIFFTII